MISIPKKVADRFAANLKQIQAIVQSCKDRDLNEADTVTLVMDVLCQILGYDRYNDLTKEHQIRGTYCDLAIKQDGKICYLIECKAIGIPLKDNHIQQALNYAVNQGVEWVFLTNGARWMVFRVIFGQPVGQELIFETDLMALNPKSQGDLEMLYALSREGIKSGVLGEYYRGREAKDRFRIAALLQTEDVLKVLRRELRALTPGISVETDEILKVLRDEVIKRELMDGEKAADASKRVRRTQRKREAKPAIETKQAAAEVVVLEPSEGAENPE
jgi:predicted type IV restriction endonuclease